MFEFVCISIGMNGQYVAIVCVCVCDTGVVMLQECFVNVLGQGCCLCIECKALWAIQSTPK